MPNGIPDHVGVDVEIGAEPNDESVNVLLAERCDDSGLAATRPDVLAALSRIFWESLRGRYQAWAKTAGLARSSAGHGETGAVTGVHRAGASLNVHVHFHILCLDGVYVPDADGTLSFEPAPTPTRAELTSMLERIYARVMKWLARRRLLRNPDDAGASNAPPELSPAEALATAAMQRGSLVTLRESTDGARDDDPSIASPPPRVTDAVTHERFNLHASVHLAANDDVGRERLCRYLNRPAFSLARLRLRRDGTVSYRVKKASRGRVTERVMTPIETMARLAAMVPPPRYPLLRFHGVLAPRHRWRDRVVPRPPPARAAAAPSMRPPMEEAKAARCRPAQDAADGRAAFIFDVVPAATTATLTMTGAAKQLAPNVLSLAHWDRILQGELYATSSRIDWRTLLKRTFDVDLRVCVRCGGKLTVRTVFTDPASVAKLLAVLRCPRAPPTAA